MSAFRRIMGIFRHSGHELYKQCHMISTGVTAADGVNFNHSVQTNTKAEMAQIFTWPRGVNDVKVELQLPLAMQRFKHYRENFNWTFDIFHLYKNEAMHRTNKDGRPLALSISMGYMSASLTREFVTSELNVTTLLELGNDIFGANKFFCRSLSSSESLNAPSGFPHGCFVNGIDETDTSFRKFALWADPSRKCLSGNWRHGVCVFGLEYLMVPHGEVRRLSHLFVNKLMQVFDFDAVLCLHQWMREKRLSGRMKLDHDCHRDWPQSAISSIGLCLPLSAVQIRAFSTSTDNGTERRREAPFQQQVEILKLQVESAKENIGSQIGEKVAVQVFDSINKLLFFNVATIMAVVAALYAGMTVYYHLINTRIDVARSEMRSEMKDQREHNDEKLKEQREHNDEKFEELAQQIKRIGEQINNGTTRGIFSSIFGKKE